MPLGWLHGMHEDSLWRWSHVPHVVLVVEKSRLGPMVWMFGAGQQSQLYEVVPPATQTVSSVRIQVSVSRHGALGPVC